jgi:signal transduction histidine kinase/ActR/RegA family two-component response regulator
MPEPHLRENADTRYDAHRVLLVAYGVILLAGPSLGTMTLRSEEWAVFAACMTGTSIALVGLIQTIRRRNPLLWGKVYIFSLQPVILFSVIRTGGALSGAVGWLFTMPVLAAILVGTRWALVNAAITGTAFLAMGVAHFMLGNWKRVDNLDEAALLASASHVLALMVLFCMVILGGRRMAKSQADLRRARDEEKQASKAKSAFLANMSHEIRTPMNGIIGMAEMTLDGKLPEPERKSVEVILSCSKALLEILNDVLDISKIEAGSLTLETIAFSPRDLVTDVKNSFRTQMDNRELGWKVELDSNCPPMVNGDPTRLRQVIFNLIGNAIKFTSKGGVNLQLKWHAETEELEASVADTGIGISKDRQASIFEAFVQADVTTTREFGGTGLGLSISRRLVHAMGGELQLESQPGTGSTFFFRIPAARAEVVAPTVEQSENRSSRVWNAQVLLVEDNGVNAKVAMHTLGKHGLTVQWAKNGVEALAEVEAQDFDLILMDCQMPEMDGFEATRQIRQMPPQKAAIPIIALTAGAMNEDRKRCFEAGMDAYLSKPFRRDAFECVLARFLDRLAA